MLSEIRHKNELRWSHLHEAPGVVRCREEESRRVVAMGSEEGGWGVTSWVQSFVSQDESVLEMDGGGCTAT